MGLFRRKTTTAAPDPSQAIANLRETVTTNEMKEANLERQITEYKTKARTALAAGQKNQARQHLQRAKLYETQLAQVRQTVMTLQTQAMNVEQIQTTKTSIDAMRAGIEVQKSVMQGFDVDSLADLRDEMQEVQDTMREMQDVLAEPMNEMFADMDMELDDELDALEANLVDEQLAGPIAAGGVPVAAPVQEEAKPARAAVDTDAELAALMSGI